jgi:hypothetical protein
MTETEVLTAVAAFASLTVSIFVAGWTVYRDVVQKPRFRVTMAVKSIVRHKQPKIGPDFYVEALNMGPIPNRIGLVFLRHGWIGRRFRKKLSAFVMSDHSHLAHSANSQKVDVGDTATFVFPLDGDFVKEGFVQLGVTDGFGRTHWCTKKEYKRAMKQVVESIARGVS